MAPVNDAAAAIVHYANVGNIDTVVSDEVIRKHRGALVNVDIDQIIAELLASTDRVMARADAFDREERRRQVRSIFPTDKRSSLKQRLAATVCRTRAAAPTHDSLMRAVIRRSS